MPIDIRVRFPVDDVVLTSLHARAFGGAGESPGSVHPWTEQLERYALTWIGAFADYDDSGELIGFVQVCWDGGLHAFLLDTVVEPAHQRQGVGRALVSAAAQEAARAGCTWLHVDFEPHLRDFYLEACRFRPTAAGLLPLIPDSP